MSKSSSNKMKNNSSTITTSRITGDPLLLSESTTTTKTGQLFLEWTRKLINGSDKPFFYNIVQTSSNNDSNSSTSLFSFPKCSISKGTEQFIEKINSMIEKSSTIGGGLNHDLSQTIKQSIVLFRVLIPKVYGESMNQFPQFSMILFNDCYWMAQELDVLCVKYKTVNSSGGGDGDSGDSSVAVAVKSMLCDGAASLRAFSEAHRREFIEKQIIILTQYLEECQNFHNTKLYKKAMEKIIDHLNHLKRLWIQVLPTGQENGLVMSTFGAILEPIMNTICNSILAMKDIGESESQDIGTLMTYLIKWITENFSYDNEDVVKFIPCLYKFRAITAMMIMSLLNVVENFKTVGGSLHGLSADELIVLIKAIFEDSKNRREVITQVLRAASK